MDVDGEQAGATHWTGLRELMDEVINSFWSKVPWAGHECDLCRRTILIDDEKRSVKAAVVDGCNNTNHLKCKVHECTPDLPNLAESR